MTVTVDRLHPIAYSQLDVGVTHGQNSLTSDADEGAAVAAAGLLQSASVYQNQHLMGWGADNPEPAPGVYQWASLDQRMSLIRRTAGTPVITLCCAPDWMKGGRAGQTDWSRLEAAPTPDHYADFARLAVQAAARYPDVRYFQVWNELKGFSDDANHRPGYEDYTTFYNVVYDALNAFNPGLQIGGPYAIFSTEPGDSAQYPSILRGPYGTVDQRSLDILSYWLEHKHGAQFVAVDASSFDSKPQDVFGATRKFSDVDAWIRARTNLPIWWAEWYVSPWGGTEYDANSQNALMTVALIEMLRSGASVALRWQPEADPGRNDEAVWSSTKQQHGGQPFPFYYSAGIFRNSFRAGTPIFASVSSSPTVASLAGPKATLLVNKSRQALVVQIESSTVVLEGYAVRLVPSDQAV